MHKLFLGLLAGFLTSLLQPTTARSFDFFELPQFTSATHYRWASGEWIQSGRTTPFYSNERLDSIHTEVYESGDYTLSRREIYTYLDRLQHRVTYDLLNDQWEIVLIDSIVYDVSGWMLEQHVHMYEHGERFRTHRITPSYDAWFVHLMSKLEERIDPGPTRNEVQLTYQYYPYGLVSGILKQIWDGSEWIDSAQEVWLYSDEAWYGALKEITTRVYTNGEWHNVEKIILEGTVGLANVSSPTGDQSVLFYPNPATSELYLHSTEPQTLAIFDLQGREVKRLDHLSSATAIDVRDLPQGQYVVTVAREQGPQLVRKLVIQR